MQNFLKQAVCTDKIVCTDNSPVSTLYYKV